MALGAKSAINDCLFVCPLTTAFFNIAANKAKPIHGCVHDVNAGSRRLLEPEPQYYEMDDADVGVQPNLADVRELTGFRYFGTGSVVSVAGLVPDERTILARQQQLLDEASEFPSVKYYCTPSCERVPLERQRSTGASYFGGGFDYRSVRYFCPADDCEHLPAEPERDTGRRAFVGAAYRDADYDDDGQYRVHPVPEFGNLSLIHI